MADNLTRDEARARAALLNVSSYDVELDLTGPDDATFRSRTTVTFTCRKPGSSTFIEIAAPTLRGATLNGAALDVDGFDGSRLVLNDLAEANLLVVDADCAYSRTGEGLHRFVDPVDGEAYLYSQFETYDAHRMYACFDQPDLKANFQLRVKAPAHWTCISNGVAGDDDAGMWEFEQTPRVSTYITALIAGPYHAVYDHHDGIDLGLFCRKSLAEFLDPEELFTVTKQGFDFYHRVFDYPYPFGKYDQLFVPEFNAGAMENAGAVTFLEDYVFRSKVTDARRERRAETILHEMAHMWFGDLVTMRWWDDLWLNESFATYASVLAQVSATRWKGAWTTFATTEKSWAARQDQLPSTHPIVADAVDMEAVKTNFDGITYAKGASVLKQLVAWVGQKEFLAGLRNYFRRFEYDNTSLRDLLDELEVASGRDLNGWAREWLETTGVNTLRPRFETDSSGIYTAFDVVQEAVPEHPTLRSHRIAIGLYDRTASGLERRERVELDVSGALTEVPKLLGARQPDLLLLNDDDLTYAKIRLDPHSLATTVESIGDVKESLPRALLWGAAWDMTRDAEMAARDHLRLVLGGLPAESDISMVQTLLARAGLAIDAYGDPASRAQSRQQLTDGVLSLLQSAPPGSDHQLALLYTFATAEDPTGLDRVRAILDGREELPGLELDTELRWHLLIELAAHGRATADDIAAELARDATAAGEKRAASARAAIPTAEAKAAAWAAVVERDDLSNHMQVATMRTFWRYEPEQIEVTKPYVAKYFDAVGDVWRQRSMDSAQTLTELLFPSTVISEETQSLVDQYLAEQSPQPALRRMLVEGRDTLARALRAQAYDTQHG
ncbi:MAG TPA: aminopeptidase N [Frankiaceae bacterium]|nr:aminopeptidase N [Frankiaceae bacterium]